MRERVVGTRASRITRPARRASGTAGFIHSSLATLRDPPRSSAANRPFPPLALAVRGHSRRMRTAECPRTHFCARATTRKNAENKTPSILYPRRSASPRPRDNCPPPTPGRRLLRLRRSELRVAQGNYGALHVRARDCMPAEKLF